MLMPVCAVSIRIIFDKDQTIAFATCSWVRPVTRRALRSSVRRRRRSIIGLALSFMYSPPHCTIASACLTLRRLDKPWPVTKVIWPGSDRAALRLACPLRIAQRTATGHTTAGIHGCRAALASCCGCPVLVCAGNSHRGSCSYASLIATNANAVPRQRHKHTLSRNRHLPQRNPIRLDCSDEVFPGR
jgi:hypothetical protein